jgi:hypothetical protein
MARLFNGTSDYLTATLDLSSTAVITVTFRLYWDSYANNDDWALSYSSNPDAGFEAFAVSPNHNSGNFQITMSGPGGSVYWGDFFARPSAAAWHLYTFVFDRTTPVNKAWVDGVSQTLSIDQHNAAVTGNFSGASTALNIMRLGIDLLWGAGRMAELAIWDAELSAADLVSLHAGTLPRDLDRPDLGFYLPIGGTTSPEPAVVGNPATVNGAVFADHPIWNPIISPFRSQSLDYDYSR